MPCATLDLRTAATLHRVPACLAPTHRHLHSLGQELVVLPVRLPSTTDTLACRRTLHRLLGPRLASYCIRVDAARGATCVELNLRRADLAQCTRLLVAGLRCAEFGRITALSDQPGHPGST